ncbi:MAG: protoheme IX farnesyltransferase [Marine Group III euryarchaeote CG-Bathy1]|uniref:Protoheme IX farnesyltransferase n=1 Tax=Marine Group III euryarchaeote CG-Bathy1 TaxID=1889001 RepID=A0A1J5TF50_9ARCH|nr:MAG: protoheme IX farnesyltransferase [Marine Group III euryarchaeote CG-Bathy1]
MNQENEMPSLLLVYWRLLKPRVVMLLQITAVCGVVIYNLMNETVTDKDDIIRILNQSLVVLIGGTLTGGGAGTINMWYERDIDNEMDRTDKRPIPMGHISPEHALMFGISCVLLGALILWNYGSLEASIVAVLSAIFYVLIYTVWLKPRTAQNIVIGGAAGSTPPLIGWAVAGGNITETIPWLMFVIIFLWTPPHFWALSLLKVEEYRKVGLPMLPVVKGKKYTRNSIVAYAAILLLSSLVLGYQGGLGRMYMVVATVLGGYFLYLSEILRTAPTTENTMRVFRYSINYLALIFSTIVIDIYI